MKKETLLERMTRLGYTSTINLYKRVPVLRHGYFDCYMGQPHFEFPPVSFLSDFTVVSSDENRTWLKVWMHRDGNKIKVREVVNANVGESASVKLTCFPATPKGFRDVRKLLNEFVTPEYLRHVATYDARVKEEEAERVAERQKEKTAFVAEHPDIIEARKDVRRQQAALCKAQKSLTQLELSRFTAVISPRADIGVARMRDALVTERSRKMIKRMGRRPRFDAVKEAYAKKSSNRAEKS